MPSVWTAYCIFCDQEEQPMRALIEIAFVILLFLGHASAQGGSAAAGSITGDAFPKGTNGEPAVLPGALVVLRGPITRETGSDVMGAFAIDGPPPGTYQMEANAPGLSAVLAVAGSAGRSSTVPVEMNVSAVTSTTSPQLTRLKAMDCAFSRKVHHA